MSTQQDYHINLLIRFLKEFSTFPDNIEETDESRLTSIWTSLLHTLALIFDSGIILALADSMNYFEVRYIYAFDVETKNRLFKHKFIKDGLLKKILLPQEICIQDKASEIDDQFSAQGIESVLAVEISYFSNIRVVLICNRDGLKRPNFNVPYLIQDKKLCRTILRRFSASDIINSANNIGVEDITNLTIIIGRSILRGHLDECALPGLYTRLEELFIKQVQQNIEIQFEPIVSLRTGEYLGYEVLTFDTRPKSRSLSTHLYREAEILGSKVPTQLDLIYIQKTLDTIGDFLLTRKQLIFFSVRYATLSQKDLQDIILQSRVPPQRIVLELVDLEEIPSYDVFRKILKPLANLGITFATNPIVWQISTFFPKKLENYLGLKTHYMKIGKMFISQLSDPTFSSFLDNLVKSKEQANTLIIAESVNDYLHIAQLIELGVPYAQGNLLAEPISYPSDDDFSNKKDFILDCFRKREERGN